MNKFVTPIAGAALAILCLAGTTSAHDSQPVFSDVPTSSVYHAAIEKAYNEGLVSGRGDGTFDPQGAVTHAELYQILAKAVGAETGEAGGHWAGKAILYFENDQTIQELPIGDPSFDEPVRRAEGVATIYKVLSKKGFLSHNTNNATTITDEAAIPAEYKENVHNAFQAGLMEYQGSNVSFVPNGYLTRGSLCAMLANSGADFSQTEQTTIDPKTVKVNKDGFQEQAVDGPGIRSIRRQGRTYYSIKDIATYTGDTVSDTKPTTSEAFFHGGLENPIYDVTAMAIDFSGTTYKFQEKSLEQNKTITCTDNKATDTAYMVMDGDLYITAKMAQQVTGKTYVSADGELSILTNTEYPAFISASKGLSNEEKDAMLHALWLLYNAAPDNYTAVMEEVGNIQLASSDYLRSFTGKDALAAAPYTQTGSVLWAKDSVLTTSPEYTAATLAHEATHFQQYRVGDRTETVPEMVGDTVLATLQAAN